MVATIPDLCICGKRGKLVYVKTGSDALNGRKVDH